MYKKSNLFFSDENMNKKKTLKIAEIFSTTLVPDLFMFL